MRTWRGSYLTREVRYSAGLEDSFLAVRARTELCVTVMILNLFIYYRIVELSVSVLGYIARSDVTVVLQSCMPLSYSVGSMSLDSVVIISLIIYW